MIVKLLLGLAIIFTLFTLIHKYKKAPAAERRSWAIKIAIAVAVIAVIVGSMTGRVPIVAGLLAAGATLARFGLRWGLPMAKMWLAKSGGNATFRSQYLVMSVNVSSGQMTGKVIKGEFAEQSLGNLSDAQLEQLQAFFASEDKKSYYLLAAYIRSRGFTQAQDEDQGQSQSHHQGMASNTSGVSVDEAMEILGFKEMPTKKEITAAHRRLMSKLHPDKGGSDYLAARVNRAREVLIEALEQQ
ncbi:MAG TPA: hypothetical protein VIC26_07640 [Marinagarivorans sp.]